jgi:hypothetical protein
MTRLCVARSNASTRASRRIVTGPGRRGALADLDQLRVLGRPSAPSSTINRGAHPLSRGRTASVGSLVIDKSLGHNA